MIIYNSTWSILTQWIRVMIVRWQSDLVNTKLESERPDCDKPYHSNKSKVQKGEEIFKFSSEAELRNVSYQVDKSQETDTER